MLIDRGSTRPTALACRVCIRYAVGIQQIIAYYGWRVERLQDGKTRQVSGRKNIKGVKQFRAVLRGVEKEGVQEQITEGSAGDRSLGKPSKCSG